MKKIYAFALLALLAAGKSFGQLKIQGEIRPRTELYNGNNTPKTDDGNVPGLATQQRSRLTLSYQGEGFKIVFSPQLVHFWGQMPQAYDLLGDGAPGAPESNFSVFEAYAEYDLTDATKLKFGRQALSYGDQRILGALGWAASGRAHDAFVGKFKFGDVKLDAGFTLNQTRHSNDFNPELQNIRAGNKSLQYLWMDAPMGDSKLTLMALNVSNLKATDANNTFNGLINNTTLGVLPKLKFDDITVDLSGYYQFSGDKHTAWLASAAVTFKTDFAPITVGADIVSGKAYDDTDAKSKTWQQPFGTNHKFYGLMDFFYVGPDDVTAGLNDYFIKSVLKAGSGKLVTHLHYFTTNKEYLVTADDGVTTSASTDVGAEIDLIYKTKIAKKLGTAIGYSQFFAADDWNVLPSGDFNNWVWLQLTAKF